MTPANKLGLEGQEYASCNRYGRVAYFTEFINECAYGLGEDEAGRAFDRLPKPSRYIKSEDILYEIKKIQQSKILGDDYVYEYIRKGMPKERAGELRSSWKMAEDLEILKYAQEKYSNGETTLQLLDLYLEPDALYLLDEPEVSLSPRNQVLMAENINKLARFLGCQFVISTHSPFMLGTLGAKIYNLDSDELETAHWTELENVRYFYDFFRKHKEEFEGGE